MKDRPFTTLFLLTSVDGKISTGASDALNKLGVLKLEQCDVLENSYLRLRYRVVG